MKSVYNKNIELRTSDFNKFGILHSSSILDLFQEAAGTHAKLLGSGFEDMLKKDIIWVLTKVKFQVNKYPQMHSTVTVKTWPLQPQKATYLREYEVFDAKTGELLIIGSSEWVLINVKTRKLITGIDVYGFESSDYFNEKCFDGKFKRLKVPENSVLKNTVCPDFRNIDINGHVNNTVYADFVFNSLEVLQDKPLKYMQIDYHKEIFEGEKEFIYAAQINNECFAYGKSDSGNVNFVCYTLF